MVIPRENWFSVACFVADNNAFASQAGKSKETLKGAPPSGRREKYKTHFILSCIKVCFPQFDAGTRRWNNVFNYDLNINDCDFAWWDVSDVDDADCVYLASLTVRSCTYWYQYAYTHVHIVIENARKRRWKIRVGLFFPFWWYQYIQTERLCARAYVWDLVQYRFFGCVGWFSAGRRSDLPNCGCWRPCERIKMAVNESVKRY